MAPFDEAENLLAAASKDLRALEGMHDRGVFADEVFGFHVQQAIEKALKAWIASLDVEYARTHDLSLLLDTLGSLGQDVASWYDLIEFNPYAVQYRYDAFEDLGEPLERRAVMYRVQVLLRDVQ